MLFGLGLGIWAYTAPYWLPRNKRIVAAPVFLIGGFALSAFHHMRGIVPFAISYIAAMTVHHLKIRGKSDVLPYEEAMKPITIAGAGLALIGLGTS
jgi:hypothetical protein